jgi:cytochrome c
MSSLEFTKISAAVLSAAIIASVSGFVTHLLYQAEAPGKNAYPVMVTAAAPATGGQAVAPGIEPIGPMLASADVAAGQKTARKCTSCHTFEEGGANKIGPNLWNLVDRQIASTGGYKYSAAFQELAGDSWSYDKLNSFLTKPKDMVPGTKMQFAGLRKSQDRANLVAYLRSLSSDPAPLPE